MKLGSAVVKQELMAEKLEQTKAQQELMAEKLEKTLQGLQSQIDALKEQTSPEHFAQRETIAWTSTTMRRAEGETSPGAIYRRKRRFSLLGSIQRPHERTTS